MFNLRVSHVKFKDLECPILKVRGITCPINMIFSLFINLRHVLVSINPLFLKLCCVQSHLMRKHVLQSLIMNLAIHLHLSRMIQVKLWD